MLTKSSYRTITSMVLSALFLMVLTACAGGGTRGTGDLRSITVEGNVLSETGEPLAGIEVADLRSGSAGISNESGSYSFKTQARVGEELEVLIHSEQINETRSLGILSEEALVINAQIVVSASSDTVVVTEITVNPSTAPPTPSPDEEITQQPEDDGQQEKQNPSRTVRILGKIISSDDTPLSGIGVTLRGIGSHDTTAANGQFELRTTSDKTKFRLRMRTENYDEEATISNLPVSGDLLIRITIRIILPELVGQGIIQPDQIDSQPEITRLTVSRQ